MKHHARRIEDYADIINLPHPESKHHPRMDKEKRAAQFAPFAALTGHGSAVNETTMQHEINVNNEITLEPDEDAKELGLICVRLSSAIS